MSSDSRDDSMAEICLHYSEFKSETRNRSKGIKLIDQLKHKERG